MKRYFEPTDVHCPFRLHVPEGLSSFTVMVPREFIHERRFYFADLSLAPDYYNLKSAQDDLDTEEELQAETQHELYVSARLDADTFYPLKYDMGRLTNVVAFVKEVNTFFETSKPKGVKRSVFFFDWNSLQQEESGETIDEFVQTMSTSFYGGPYDPAKFYNALPPSVRSLSSALGANINNNVYPTQRSATVVSNLRWRMWIAPFTKVTVSSDSQLLAMGFTEAQIGQRRTKKQFVFENNTNEYQCTQALNPPADTFVGTRCGIALYPLNTEYVSPVVSFATTARDEQKNVSIEEKLQAAVKEASDESNLDFNVAYDDSNKTFKFAFPDNDTFEMTIHVSVELAAMTGYGFVTDITRHSKSNPRPDNIDIKDASEKSRTLAFDTGLVIVEVDNVSSNTTSGLENKFMAALYPNESGILTLSSACHPPATTNVPWFLTGGSTVPVKFRFLRFVQNYKLVPLVWKTGAYVNGVLRGSKL